jgi:Mg2+ and Co2+ transporter CorA
MHLVRALQDIQGHSRFMLNRKNMTLQDILKMSEHVTNMKRLLSELERIEYGMGKSEQPDYSLADLKAVYDELESMLRETRSNQNGRKQTKTVSGTQLFSEIHEPAWSGQ